jgi:hypothetical protein
MERGRQPVRAAALAGLTACGPLAGLGSLVVSPPDLRRRWLHIFPRSPAPAPVLVETLDGKWRAAFCYLAPAPASRPASNDYIDRIVAPARQHGFPDWYIARLESFRSR